MVKAELERGTKGLKNDAVNICSIPEASPASPTERTSALEILSHFATAPRNELAPFLTGRQTPATPPLPSLSAIVVDEQGGKFITAAVP